MLPVEYDVKGMNKKYAGSTISCFHPDFPEKEGPSEYLAGNIFSSKSPICEHCGSSCKRGKKRNWNPKERYILIGTKFMYVPELGKFMQMEPAYTPNVAKVEVGS